MSDELEVHQPAPGPDNSRFVFLGFNSTIDRGAVAKLMSAVGIVLEHKPRPTAIVLCISSEGGAVDAAFYAYEMLRSLPIGVATHNVGMVASAANILFMAGNLRLATSRSSFMFHDTRYTMPPIGVVSQQELNLTVANLQDSDLRAASIIAERTERPLVEVQGWFSETMRPAEFAKEHGIVSEICPVIIRDQDDFMQIIP